ncbi:MAG: glutamate synthase small subunit [Candidatus Latescibacteria bacterium]|nr:glutamate synthase small subunit [Candidatus Latescibacterota bacterium]
MAKPTGFIDYARRDAQDRPPAERLGDWGEFRARLPPALLQQQAARCMDCGIPFCHQATEPNRAGKTAGCPLGNLIPEWNDLAYQGLWEQALERLHKTNNFPEFTGRVCPAPCEESCTVGLHGEAVTIKQIEVELVDRGFAQGWIRPQPPVGRTGKRVAVVGSGPAGLACAAQLNKAGHWVTVFERADRAGGLLMYGVPAMKLEKHRVQRRVDMLAAEGVRFVLGTEIGADLPVRSILDDFDAAVLCAGATRARDLPVPGRHLAGVHFAMDFLHGNTRRLLDGDCPEPSPWEQRQGRDYISAQGKEVVVLGGNDTGTDCVATSLRQGCADVIQFEIVPRKPDQRPADNPWPQWPEVFRRFQKNKHSASSRRGFHVDKPLG